MEGNASFKITRGMIHAITNATYFRRGENYQSSGSVISGWISENTIKAKVSGNCAPYYLVKISLTRNMRLTGSCTCPIGFGCKHTVATCLQYLYKPKFFKQKNVKKRSHETFLKGREFPLEEINGEGAGLNISIKEWIESLTLEQLRQKFIILWNEMIPFSLDHPFNRDYPYQFYNSRIFYTEEFQEYKQDGVEEEMGEQDYSPHKILLFFSGSKIYRAVLHQWTLSLSDLWFEIQEEFETLGLTRESIEYDPEIHFGPIIEDEFQDSWNYYDEDYGYIDAETLSDEYFAQYEALFEETFLFYELLLHENMTHLAEALFERSLQWLIELPLFKSYEQYGLEKLSRLQQNMSESIENLQAESLMGEDKITFLLTIFLNNKSESSKITLFSELDLIQDEEEKQEIAAELWKTAIRDYNHAIDFDNFQLLWELDRKYIQNSVKIRSLIKNTFFWLKEHSENPQDFVYFILDEYGMNSEEKQDWLYDLLINQEIGNKKITDNKNKNALKAIFPYCFDWFFKTNLEMGKVKNITNLCNKCLKTKPSMFQYSHWIMIKEYYTNNEQIEKELKLYLKESLLPGLVSQSRYWTACEIFIDLNNYSQAIGLVHSHFSKDRAWLTIRKIHSNIIKSSNIKLLENISKDDFLLLLKIVNKYISMNIKLNSRDRPDKNIARSVQLMLYLFNHFSMDLEGEKWFKKFCTAHKRLRNLRAALKSLGIEMI